MVAHLHPRSRMTTGLFGATLAVSFLVVGLPHLVPCPVPRTAFADSQLSEDGRRRRRRRKVCPAPEQEGTVDAAKDKEDVSVLAAIAQEKTLKEQRECPVPKPGGFVGRFLGFKEKEDKSGPVEIQVEVRK